MLTQILIALALIAVLFLILAPIIYYVNREKDDEKEAEEQEAEEQKDQLPDDQAEE